MTCKQTSPMPLASSLLGKALRADQVPRIQDLAQAHDLRTQALRTHQAIGTDLHSITDCQDPASTY